MTILLIARILVALFFIYAGYAHFTKKRFFYKITPPILQPWKESINVIVGISEIAGGIGLLLPFSQTWAAWGIIALLVAVFPANIYMLTSKGAGMKINIWFLWLRLPLQVALIALVYQFV
jgi:uncharacterized membrane protein